MRWLLAAGVLGILSTAPIARAQQTETESEPASESESETESETEPEPEDADEPLTYAGPLLTERRPAPSYDGREPAPTTFGQKLLWVPRVLFFPIYVVWEYLVRVPIGAAVPELEKADAIALLFDFFTWENRNAGLVPTFFFDFGFLPSLGLYFFWNDVLVKGNNLRVWGGFWGVQYLHAALIDRIAVGDGGELELVFDFLRRPDQVYGGQGYDARVNTWRSRYNLELTQAHLSFRQDFWRQSQLRVSVGVEQYEFADTDWGDQPSVPEAVEQGLFTMPENFVDGYTKIYQSIQLAIDSRRSRPNDGSGIRLQAYGELGYNAQDIAGQRWFRYGGTGGAWLDVGAQRTIGLGGGALFADPVGDRPVPFEELVRIDDFPNLITGYFQGDLRGRSAAGLTLVYRYPIWVWLEGVANVSVANVFGEHLEDFDFDRLRLTWGLGISTIAERDTSFTLEVAFGTDTFEQGTNISSFRLAVGATEL